MPSKHPMPPAGPMERKDFFRRLDGHFLTCSGVMGAAALLAAPAAADAAIVYSGAKNVAVPSTSTGLSIDLDTGTFSTTGELSGTDISFQVTHGSSSSAQLDFKGGATADQAVTVGSSSDKSIALLAAGAVVSSGIASSNLANAGTLGSASSSGSTNGPWKPGETGYVGFKFVSAENTTLYGWARLAVGADYSTTVVDWAYENSGAPIIVGAVKTFAVGLQIQGSVASVSGGPATVVFTRKGGGKSLPLTVHYEVKSKSTAVSGEDYTALPGTIIIPEAEKSVTLSIPALANPARDGTRTLKLKILPGAGYTVLSPPSGNINVEN